MGKAKDKAKANKAAAQRAAVPVVAPAKTDAAKPTAVAATTPTKTAASTPAPTKPTQPMTAIQAIALPIVKGSTTMTDQFQQFAQIFNPKGLEQFFGPAKEQVEKAQAQSTKALEDMTKFSKENLDAVVSASTVYAKGFETFGKAWYAFSQETVEASAAVAKQLLGVKTLKEAVDLQTDFAKTTFDKFVAESTKLSEMSIKVANEALEPINARVNVAVEKLLKPAKAA
ncbi:MAG: phasin family protein [Proteobacteria bacterium]|nr:phasin family protein [Pseudomonadota bacterium]